MPAKKKAARTSAAPGAPRQRTVPTIRTCAACGREFEGKGQFCVSCLTSAGLTPSL